MLQRAHIAAAIPCLVWALGCGSTDAGGAEPEAAGATGGSEISSTSGAGGASQGGSQGVVQNTGGSSTGGASVNAGGAGQAAGAGGRGGTNGAGGSTGGGGSAGGGGNPGAGGSAGGPPAVVGSCASLGASGVWEKITPPGVLNSQAMTMDPFNIGTLWLGASPSGNQGAGLGGVFKSTDCGATWAHVNSGTNGTQIDGCHMWSLSLDPVDPGTIYVIGAYGPGGLWKSTNAGVDWVQLFPSTSEFAKVVPYTFVGSVSMDPHDHLHLVVGTHSNCTGQYAPTCGAESKDGGATWTIFKTSFMSSWAEQTGPYVIDASTFVYATLSDGIWLTTDHGANWKNISPAGVAGATGGEYTHRAIAQGSDGTYYLPAYNKGGLLSSADGRTWSLLAGSPMGSYELGFAVGGGHVFMGDRNGLTYNMASDVKPTTWTALPKSPAAANEGAVFLEYDNAHHVLYSSNFEGGLWRMVTP